MHFFEFLQQKSCVWQSARWIESLHDWILKWLNKQTNRTLGNWNGIWKRTKLSSPGPSPSPSRCPNRPPSQIKVPPKKKKKAFSKHSKSTQRAREQSDLVILSEPKILCLDCHLFLEHVGLPHVLDLVVHLVNFWLDESAQVLLSLTLELWTLDFRLWTWT